MTCTGKAVSLSTASLIPQQTNSRKTVAEYLCCSYYCFQRQIVLIVYSKYSHYTDYDGFKFFIYIYRLLFITKYMFRKSLKMKTDLIFIYPSIKSIKSNCCTLMSVGEMRKKWLCGDLWQIHLSGIIYILRN